MNIVRKQWHFIFIGGVALLIIVAVFAAAKFNHSTSISKPQPKQMAGSTPIRIIIPAIQVDAAIEEVGLTSNGAVDVPKDSAHAAWYDRSVRPGEVGDAVIDGHYGWKNNEKAVFDNLSKLRAGDEITVQDSTGTTSHFIVRELRTVSSEQIVPDIFISTDGKSHLNLITCEGIWNKSKHSYSERLVVFADKKL